MEATKRREKMDQTFLFHRVMTQGYRWFQLYEHQEVDLRNQLDILAPDVHIHSSFGEANNRQEYAQAATNLPAHWRNAHHVLAADVKPRDDGSVALTMEVAFQNTGYLPEGKMMAKRLRYTTALSC